MNNIVNIVKKELYEMSAEPVLKTNTIRKISAKIYHSFDDKEINTIFNLCEQLLECHNWELGVIAYDWAFRVRKQYTQKNFLTFESWLLKYVSGWGDCDDFCTHAFAELLIQYPELYERAFIWTSNKEFWVRRASAVILIPAISQGNYVSFDPLKIADALMKDEHDLVKKGFGWMLKIYSIKEKQIVYDYLLKNKEIMPRTAFRYALEKMDKIDREILMDK